MRYSAAGKQRQLIVSNYELPVGQCKSICKYITFMCVFNSRFRASQFNVNKNPTRCNSMQIFIYCKVTLHVSDVTAPIIRSTKNCNRSLRYFPPTWPVVPVISERLKNVCIFGSGPAKTYQATLEGSSCTCTGGCGYSF